MPESVMPRSFEANRLGDADAGPDFDSDEASVGNTRGVRMGER